MVFKNSSFERQRSKIYDRDCRAVAVLAFILLEEDEENEGDQIDRTYWVQPLPAKREQFGAFHEIFQENVKELSKQ